MTQDSGQIRNEVKQLFGVGVAIVIILFQFIFIYSFTHFTHLLNLLPGFIDSRLNFILSQSKKLWGGDGQGGRRRKTKALMIHFIRLYEYLYVGLVTRYSVSCGLQNEEGERIIKYFVDSYIVQLMILVLVSSYIYHYT